MKIEKGRLIVCIMFLLLGFEQVLSQTYSVYGYIGNVSNIEEFDAVVKLYDPITGDSETAIAQESGLVNCAKYEFHDIQPGRYKVILEDNCYDDIPGCYSEGGTERYVDVVDADVAVPIFILIQNFSITNDRFLTTTVYYKKNNVPMVTTLMNDESVTFDILHEDHEFTDIVVTAQNPYKIWNLKLQSRYQENFVVSPFDPEYLAQLPDGGVDNFTFSESPINEWLSWIKFKIVSNISVENARYHLNTFNIGEKGFVDLVYLDRLTEPEVGFERCKKLGWSPGNHTFAFVHDSYDALNTVKEVIVKAHPEYVIDRIFINDVEQPEITGKKLSHYTFNASQIAILNTIPADNENVVSVTFIKALGTITGKIYDITTNQGIEGVQVYVNALSGITDPDGFYKIDYVAEGTYAFWLAKDGYKNHYTDPVQVVPGGHYDFPMIPDGALKPVVNVRVKNHPKGEVPNSDTHLTPDEIALKDKDDAYCIYSWCPVATETVTLIGDVTQPHNPHIPDLHITEYHWYKHQGTGEDFVEVGNQKDLPDQTLELFKFYRYKLVAANSAGLSTAYILNIKLVPCVPNFLFSSTIIRHEDDEGKLKIITGNSIFSADNGVEKLHFSLQWDIDCIGEVIMDQISWNWEVDYLDDAEPPVVVSNTNSFPPQEPTYIYSDYLTGGYGRYEARFIMMYKGEKVLSHTRKFYVAFPVPFTLCPVYGCRAVADLYKGFETHVDETDLIPHYETPSDNTFSYVIKPVMGGIARNSSLGMIDMCTFASLSATGDFIMVMKVPSDVPYYYQVGLMMRKSSLGFDQMVHIGREMDKVYVYNRKMPFEDIAPKIGEPQRDNHTCFRIDRVDGKISLYSAMAQGDACPPIDGDWGEKIAIDGRSEIDGWAGAIKVGIAAADAYAFSTTPQQRGETGVTISSLQFIDNDVKLKQLPVITNTVFASGNLISNWSFENQHQFFGPKEIISTDEYYDPRFEETETEKAWEGRYFARMKNKRSGKTLQSAKIPYYYQINNDHASYFYLSFMYKANTANTAVSPVLTIYNNDNTTQHHPLTATLSFSELNVWHEFTERIDLLHYIDAYAFVLHLVDPDATVNGTIDFDNVRIYPYHLEAGLENTSNSPVTTIDYVDGLMQKFQTIQRHGSTEDYVAATLLDQEGRVVRALPVFADNNPSSIGEVKTDPVALMTQYFTTPDESRPYAQDEKNIAVKPSLSDFREDHGTIVYDGSPKNRIVKEYGRIADKSLDVEYTYINDVLDQIGPPPPDAIPHYMVNIVKTSVTGNYEDHRVRKEYIDPLGFKTKTILEGASKSEDLVSYREPDVLGRTWKVVSPLGSETQDNHDDFATTYNYDTRDNVIETTDPDAGVTRSLYDKSGNVRLFQDGNTIASNEIIVNKYDAFGRVTEVYLVNNTGENYFSQSYADTTDWPDNTVAAKTLVLKHEYDKPPKDVPVEIAPEELTYLKGKTAASHSYSTNGVVSQYFSYHYRGNVKQIWLKIADIPLQKQTFTYNLANMVILKKTEGEKPGTAAAGNESYVKYERFTYDELNRLKQVEVKYADDGIYTKVAAIEYWPDGKIRYKDFGDDGVQSIAYQYDPAERVQFIRHEAFNGSVWTPTHKYDQHLSYNVQNNIASIYYNLPSFINEYTRGFYYTYDYFNRLLHADFGSSNGGRLNMGADKFDAKYTYDKDGAIATQARGTLANHDISEHGQYNYYGYSHRLLNIVGNSIEIGGKDRRAHFNYVYDENGNVIEDKSLRRRITYDYRNLPVTITHYADDLFTIKKSVTTFLYDSNGKRVAKFQHNLY